MSCARRFGLGRLSPASLLGPSSTWLWSLLLLGSVLLLAPSGAFADVVNGDFESPVVGSGYATYFAGQSFDGWMVGAGSIDLITTSGAFTWMAASGGQSVDLNGFETGSISQDLPTVAGSCYQLRFAMAENQDGSGPFTAHLSVRWNGSEVDQPTFDGTGHSSTSMGWTYHPYTVPATSDSTRLEFSSLDPNTRGPALDDVSVSPSPGPCTSQPLPSPSGKVNPCAAGAPTPPGCPPPPPRTQSPQGPSYFDGERRRAPSAIGGIYGRILNYSPWLSSGGSASSAWVMLQGCRTDGGDCYQYELAQIGWGKQALGRRTLIEYLDNNEDHDTQNDPHTGHFQDCDQARNIRPDLWCLGDPSSSGGAAPNCGNRANACWPQNKNTFTYYTVLWNNVRGFFTFYISGKLVAAAPASFMPYAATAVGETHSIGDQMPGDQVTPEIFDDMHVYLNGKWRAYGGTVVMEAPDNQWIKKRFGFAYLPSTPSADAFAIWDNDYGNALPGLYARYPSLRPTPVTPSLGRGSAVRGHIVRITAACPQGDHSCAGKATVTTPPTGGVQARRRSPLARPVSFSLPPGLTNKVALRLRKEAVRTLKKKGHLRVRVTVSLPGANGSRARKRSRIYVLRIGRKHHRHHRR